MEYLSEVINRNFNYVTSYSPRGPTIDLRIKPDLIAIGKTSSAKSSIIDKITCETTVKEGTYLLQHKKVFILIKLPLFQQQLWLEQST